MNNNTDNIETVQKTNQEKQSFKKKILNSGIFTPFYTALMLIFLFSLLIYFLCRAITPFAEWMSRYPSQGLRFLFSKITGILHFSIAEMLLILLPLIAVLYLYFAFRYIKHNDTKFFVKCIMPLISFLMVLLILFSLMFAPGYFRYDLAENLNLQREAISPAELFDTSKWLSAELDTVIGKIKFNHENASYMDLSYNRLVEMMNSAFDDFAYKYDFINSFDSNPKPIMLSEPMTYTHISGVYSFFTGEANINVNYPDFVIPYTVAHEMAHQRGIAREDEANFIAFLVCMESDNAYIKYSGIVNTLKYILNALYSADKDLYKEYQKNHSHKEMNGELNAFSDFFKKYENSTANKITSATNNSFLQSQGQSAGVKSYNLVVDLAVAYYKSIS
ncbi:DUF3810 domain-containing protein [Eubacteriales bacterium OttesenSCG-928-G02]|nr:DUF3810 domain-containing protein [Eubacteriales bacterium OttesenSCG-928-G02]